MPDRGLRHTGRALLRLVVTSVGIVTAVFFLLRAIPGDPALAMLGDFATKQAIAALHARLGLDLPVWQQYLRFVALVAHGDLGSSSVTGQPALGEVLANLPASAALALSGMAVAVALGVPAGIVAAVRRGSTLDTVLMLAALAGISFPVFWIGLAAILGFAYWLPVFPALGYSSSADPWTRIDHLLLPALVLGISVAAYIARLTRSAMIEALGQEHIRVARAMGVREGEIVWRLALRNALVPILTIIGVTFAWSIGNAILVEAVFNRPGLGSMLLKAIQARDYQVVQAGVLVLAAAVVAINTTLDLLYAVVDPRLRVS